MANQNAILIDVEPDAIELTINDLDAVNGGAGALSTLLTILMGMRHDEIKTIQNNLRS